MVQEQGTDVAVVEQEPEAVFEDILDSPGHVVVVHLPPSSFTTSEEAATAINHAVTDMCKALGVLGPRTVAMQSRQGSVPVCDIEPDVHGIVYPHAPHGLCSGERRA